jgi:hypothetical protein
MPTPPPPAVAHTLREQLARLREIERKQILKESCDRIMREAEELPKRIILPIEGAD